MNNNDTVIEFLLNQLRQQLTNNPYKQQCEDLAHEVLSLKNQLRDASALVAEFHKDNIKKSEHILHLTGRVKELHLALVQATGDVEAYKLIRKGGYISEGQSYVVGEHVPGTTINCRCTPTPVPQEQSGCRKEDTQKCKHEWVMRDVDDFQTCSKCGAIA